MRQTFTPCDRIVVRVSPMCPVPVANRVEVYVTFAGVQRLGHKVFYNVWRWYSVHFDLRGTNHHQRTMESVEISPEGEFHAESVTFVTVVR